MATLDLIGRLFDTHASSSYSINLLYEYKSTNTDKKELQGITCNTCNTCITALIGPLSIR